MPSLSRRRVDVHSMHRTGQKCAKPGFFFKASVSRASDQRTRAPAHRSTDQSQGPQTLRDSHLSSKRIPGTRTLAFPCYCQTQRASPDDTPRPSKRIPAHGLLITLFNRSYFPIETPSGRTASSSFRPRFYFLSQIPRCDPRAFPRTTAASRDSNRAAGVTLLLCSNLKSPGVSSIKLFVPRFKEVATRVRVAHCKAPRTDCSATPAPLGRAACPESKLSGRAAPLLPLARCFCPCCAPRCRIEQHLLSRSFVTIITNRHPPCLYRAAARHDLQAVCPRRVLPYRVGRL